MNLYLLCSNEYQPLLPYFARLFNKYWANQQVVVLHYDVQRYVLPSNFRSVSIGRQGRYWSNALIGYFNSINDKYFIINLEDMFLVDYVNKDWVAILEAEISSCRADKACLHFYGPDQVIDKGRFVEFKQDVYYRTSIHPAIWSKKYWLKHLKRDQTLWDFELCNEAKNDGARIICLKEQLRPTTVFNTSNMCIRGKIQPTGFSLKTEPGDNGLVHPEDIEIVKGASDELKRCGLA